MAPRTLTDPTVRAALVVARDLEVDPETGLSEAEAGRRLAVDGPNELRAAPPGPLWRRVLRSSRTRSSTSCSRRSRSRCWPGWPRARPACRSTRS